MFNGSWVRDIGSAPLGHHTVIEASPTKAARLAKRFPYVRVESAAISDQIGTAVFEENLAQSGLSKLADGKQTGGGVNRYT